MVSMKVEAEDDNDDSDDDDEEFYDNSNETRCDKLVPSKEVDCRRAPKELSKADSDAAIKSKKRKQNRQCKFKELSVYPKSQFNKLSFDMCDGRHP